MGVIKLSSSINYVYLWPKATVRMIRSTRMCECNYVVVLKITAPYIVFFMKPSRGIFRGKGKRDKERERERENQI